MTKVLITGATGYVGGRLVARAAATPGTHVRCLVRDPSRADAARRASRSSGRRPRRRARSPARSTGVDVAYYLVHSMGAGGGDFAQTRPRAAPTPSAGGGATPASGASSTSAAWRAARLRAPAQPRGGRRDPGRRGARAPSTSRAAMVIGAGSASFLMLRHLVERLPVDDRARAGSTRARSRSPSATSSSALARARGPRRPRPTRSSSAAPTSSPTAR